MSSALAGGLLSTTLPGKSYMHFPLNQNPNEPCILHMIAVPLVSFNLNSFLPFCFHVACLFFHAAYFLVCLERKWN